MSEYWTVDDGGAGVVPAVAVRSSLRARIDAGQLETWLTSSAGRSPAFVTDAERAMVMLPAGPGDPGEHAVDPDADGWSEGFVLAGGQQDQYPDADTVPIAAAFGMVEHIVATGSRPADGRWVADRRAGGQGVSVG
ncbi:hypothetical protein [Nocardia sp. NPDC003963]